MSDKKTSDPSVAPPGQARARRPPFRPDRRLITHFGESRSSEEVRAIIDRIYAAAEDEAAPEKAT